MSLKTVLIKSFHFFRNFCAIYVYLVFLVMTAEHCLGRGINGTDHGGRSRKTMTSHEYGKHKGNVSQTGDNVNVSVHNEDNILTNTSNTSGLTSAEPHSELPLPILIASPVAALSIVILICIAYKWHSVQLDEQAKKLAIEKAVGQCNDSPCHPCSPCRATHRLVPPGQARAESDMTGTRRKSLRTPTPSISRSRGSLWSADQEVLTHVHASPRRHSTFILW